MNGKEERIRQRAHNIWLEEGKPDGRASQHWERARREIEELDGRGITIGNETSASAPKTVRLKASTRSDIPVAAKKKRAPSSKRTKARPSGSSTTREN